MQAIIISSITLFLSGFLLPVLLRWHNWSRMQITRFSLGLAALGSTAISVIAIYTFINGPVAPTTLFTPPSSSEWLPPLSFTLYIDNLAAFFLLLIGALSVGVCLYSVAYLEEKSDSISVAAVYNLFVLFGALFIMADNAFYHIVFLETTSLAFGFLILHKQRQHPDAKKHHHAIKTYLIVNHIGGLLIMTAILTLSLGNNNSFEFSDLRSQAVVAPTTAHIVFWLSFIGFGIKAGLFPFHIWVPIAHPSSPTNTHAMSLGIMIKIALYGMIRYWFQFLPASSEMKIQWGAIVLATAVLTAIVGVWNALQGRDLKESLADHSIENIGIMLAGIGLSLLLLGKGADELATLAMIAGLYHLLNHAVFKSLLYLGTGGIDYLTGTVSLERLGGLIHRFPKTAVLFLIGGVAIAGFPPFNGFVSEWLTFQALFDGMEIVSNDIPLLLLVIGSVIFLGTAVAMTALAFVKIMGETILGMPRDDTILQQEKQHDLPYTMLVPMGILAVLTLLLGLFPAYVIRWLQTIVAVIGLETAPLATVHLPPATPTLVLLLVFIGFALLLARKRPYPPLDRPVIWTGGVPYRPQIMQYNSGNYTDLLRKTTPDWTSWLKRIPLVTPWRQWIKEAINAPLEARVELSPNQFVSKRVRQGYNLLINLLQTIAGHFGAWVQNGDLRNYLAYIFVIVCLILLAFTIGGLLP